jgi:hypothetical protein
VASPLTDLMTRLGAVQEELIAGSVAYPFGFVQTGNAVYWSNFVTVVPTAGSLRDARATATVRMNLHRGKLTQTQTDAAFQSVVMDDLHAILQGFMVASTRDLLSAAYPSRHPALIPTSALLTTAAIGELSAPDGTAHIGVSATLTFGYLLTGGQ